MPYKRADVRLPSITPTGERTRTHTLLYALQQAADMGMNLSRIAEGLDVTPQTLWIWKRAAQNDRHFLLPAEQVPKLSRLTGVAPFYFRPDLWPNAKWRFE